MKFKVLFSLNASKRHPIMSYYRPDWVSDSKPDYNCAQILIDVPILNPGEKCHAILEPLAIDLWNNVVINDVLKCMEGPHQVGEAIVLEIISS